MADLSSAADHGSGHLLGHVLGDGQAVSLAAYHVGALSVYMVVFAFHLPSEAISVLIGLCPDHNQGTCQPLWHHIGHSINSTSDIITSALLPPLSDLPFYFHIQIKAASLYIRSIKLAHQFAECTFYILKLDQNTVVSSLNKRK